MKLRLHLTSRIVLIFVLFAAVLLAAVGMVSYYSGRESLKAAAVSEMLAVAIEKEAELDKWLEERTGNLKEVARASNLHEEIGKLTEAGLDGPTAAIAHRRIVADLQPNVGGNGNGYLELFVIEDGRVRETGERRFGLGELRSLRAQGRPDRIAKSESFSRL